MSDRRDDPPSKWWETLDEKRMMATIIDPTGETDEETEVSFVWEVCGTCDGKGSHVNPGVDAHGLSQEDFDEDPDFKEDYFNGAYDVECSECHGRRVTPEPVDEKVIEAVNRKRQDEADYRAECEAERRMGA